MADSDARSAPNILVCGTPGVGKSTLCAALQESLELAHINIGDVIRENGFHAGHDEEHQAYTLDEDSEDKLLDFLEDPMATGGNVVEFHSVDFFPERWFDLVLVLRADNTVLYDRLKLRQYPDKKIEENVTAEIMQVVLEEARHAYAEEIVQELPNNTPEDMQLTLERVRAWAEQWRSEHS